MLLKLASPWEYVEPEGGTYGLKARVCPVLDQDDYICVKSRNGEKRNIKGQVVYKPELGDVLSPSQNTVQVPMNFYIIVSDANDETSPIKHLRGPLKFFPEAFQTIVGGVMTNEVTANAASKIAPKPEKTRYEDLMMIDESVAMPNPNLTLTPSSDARLHPCVEISKNYAIHLQKADGTTILIDTPQFYMPEVAEVVLKVVERHILLLTDFCIVKGPSGIIDLMDGKKESDRAFFLKPFHSLVEFDCDGQRSILSTLPIAISHGFTIRTADNVILILDLRISFQIQDIKTFSSNPIEFYGYIRNNIQNDLLDRFSQFSLRLFMTGKISQLFNLKFLSHNINFFFLDFAREAQKTIEPMSAYFQKFGITILDVQILNYSCKDAKTQELLNRDIHTTVNKQNELKAAQNDVLIKEQENEITRKKKDMEVIMAQKDNEVKIQRKMMDNNIRMKEVEIDMQEEIRRTELLEIKRGNQLVEAEFEGRARGSKFKEFCNGIDPKLSAADKVSIW